jgi:hypothetical protein
MIFAFKRRSGSEADVNEFGNERVTWDKSETTTKTTTGPDGKPVVTTVERKETKKIEPADLAVISVFLLCLTFFILSLAIKPWREDVGKALPALLGVFTLAVGGVGAYKIYNNKK